MQAHTLYDRPDLYDPLAPLDLGCLIVRFYVDMARERGNQVLDLACGSGRIAIPLAEAGKQVVGGDLSPEMLQRARIAAEARGVKAEFVQLDMRDFDLGGRRFDTIVVAANSILHLHSLDDFMGFFRSVVRHLSVNGRLIFDAFVPNIALLNREPRLRYPVGTIRHNPLGDVTVDETVNYDPITQIQHTTWYWSTDRERDFWHATFGLRLIFPQEMRLLVSLGGLHLVERFGDFDRGSLTPQSSRQVCICALA